MVEKSQLLSFFIPNIYRKQNLLGGARDIDGIGQRDETMLVMSAMALTLCKP